MDATFLKDLKLPFNTPDRVQLENSNSHLLFDYGKIKADKDIYCSAYTVEKMSLFIRREDHLDIALRLPGRHRARIGGTLYKVTPEDLIRLDKARQNRILFERRPIPVFLPNQDKHRDIEILPVPAWVYVGIPDQWGFQIESSFSRYNVPVSNPEFVLAKTYTDNQRLLNNHFRYADKRLEDYIEGPAVKRATEEVVDYVRKKNEAAIHKPLWKRILRR